MVLQNGPILHCQVCQKNLNLYAFIQRSFQGDHFYPSWLAQSYFEWTRDNQVPAPFTLVNIEGIFPTRVQDQSLHHVEECIDLLRGINSPFTTEWYKPSYDLGNFINNYLHILSKHRVSSGDSNLDAILDHLMKGMHEMVQSHEFENPFQYYFDKLVPFVQQSVPGWEPLPSTPKDPNLGKELMLQLILSSNIRKQFGIYSVPFDIIHVMVGCFVSSCDSNLVANWVLDFVARVCRGQYFWTQYPSSPFVQAMTLFFDKEISYKKRVHLYKVVRQIRNGEAAEGLSEFWQPYIELQSFVSEKFNIPQIPFDSVQVAIQQTFPAVLFKDHGDHLGFIVAVGYIASKTDMKTRAVEKGSFKRAREIHNRIKKFVHSVKEFDSIPNYWTVDTLKQFIASMPHLNEEILELFQLLFKEKNEV